MAYRDNVTKVARRFDIVNDSKTGLPEDELMIRKLVFYKEGRHVSRVEATPMNKGARLFFQDLAVSSDRCRSRIIHRNFDAVRTAAREYFAETWDENATQEQRPLIWSIVHADEVHIMYKRRNKV